MTCYYDEEDFFIVPEKEKVYNKYYQIDSNILSEARKKLKKRAIDIRQIDFHPKTGVLGELKDYFVKNEINY